MLEVNLENKTSSGEHAKSEQGATLTKPFFPERVHSTVVYIEGPGKNIKKLVCRCGFRQAKKFNGCSCVLYRSQPQLWNLRLRIISALAGGEIFISVFELS